MNLKERIKGVRSGFEAAKTPVSGRAAAIRDSLFTKDSFQNLYREAYSKGMNLSTWLERLDPSSEHPKGSGDAFQRILISAGIRLKSDPARGYYASELGEIVENERYPYIAPLALELISRAYRSAIFHPTRDATFDSGFGIPGTNLAPWTYSPPRDVNVQPAVSLDDVVARTTGIDQAYYKPFYLEEVADANSRVAEEGEIPRVKIATSEKTVNLVKYGRRIDMTYEASRRIPIDLLAFNIQRIAIVIETAKVDKVVSIMVNGDGNSGTAPVSYNLTALDSTTTANHLTLLAYMAFRLKFKNPLVMNTALANEGAALALMTLNMGSANIPLIAGGPVFGAQQVTLINTGLRDGVRLGALDSPPSNTLIGFDKRFAVERLFEIGSNIQESDKDVKTQLNSLVLSEVEGYDIIDPKATKLLNLAA